LTDAFIEAARAQEKLKMAEQRDQLMEQSLQCVKQKVENGKASTIDQKKTEIDCYCNKVATCKARQALEQAKRKIALIWGCPHPDFRCVSYPFYYIEPPPELSTLDCSLDNAPEWSKGQLSLYAAAAATALENANRYPDLEVSGGVTVGDGFGDHSFFVEFSLPLQIFDRNQGNISRACLQELQAKYLFENMIGEIRYRLDSTYSELVAAYENAQIIQKFTSSSVEGTVHGTQEAYEQGKFQMTELLDAQKSALDIKDQLIDALAEYHHKKAEIMRITGQIAKD